MEIIHLIGFRWQINEATHKKKGITREEIDENGKINYINTLNLRSYQKGDTKLIKCQVFHEGYQTQKEHYSLLPQIWRMRASNGVIILPTTDIGHNWAEAEIKIQ